ncbi:hypothetical protein LTR56_017078 [Elasticomyces elasticus]|nr:hypothetical protein LTR56_017078 [Elasticomyces elasticus]KAK4915180.1 hypothetical protein LTR49_016689 [Elasticomyces elasticus]KAK5744473.1 hypothetical protein LTS12_023467 [Elasticomyces elasticus]
MRLLNTTTLEFEEFIDTKQVKYSILSHCWSQDRSQPEVTHKAFLAKSYNEDGAGYQKILRCCELSVKQGYEYAWIDTCCVDKTSSAELSETINSMFAWYRDSAECYVFMDDLAVETLPIFGKDEKFDIEGRWRQGLGLAAIDNANAFMSSRWFLRGWTLQELLAPRGVLFYNRHARYLGGKLELAPLIAHATGIHVPVIRGSESMFNTTIAQRMSWASARQTTRREDMAYSLLGIFDVNMPLLYGEGNKAFMRLQEAILRQSDDQSIFAWGLNEDQQYRTSVLAVAPSAFKGSGNVISSYHRLMLLNPGLDLVNIPSGHNGERFADMVSFNLVKQGLEIHHRNVMYLDDSIMPLNLGCYDWRGNSSETILNVRLNLRTLRGDLWERTSIACENTSARKWLNTYVQYTKPLVLCVSADGYLKLYASNLHKVPAMNYSMKAWITFWMKMVPAQTLAIIAVASFVVELNASNSPSGRATQWLLMGLVALAVVSCQGTGKWKGRRSILTGRRLTLDHIHLSVRITLRAVFGRLQRFFLLLIKHYFGQDHETVPTLDGA